MTAQRADLQRIDPRPDVPAQGRRHGDRPLREPPRPRRPASTGTASSCRTRATARRSPRTRSQPGGTFLYKFKVTRARDLLVPPAPPLLDQPGVQGPVRDDRRHRPERGRAAGAGHAPVSRGHEADSCSATPRCARAPGNDTATYAPGSPARRRRVSPAQPAPTPKDLCETPTAIDEDGQSAARRSRRRHPEHPDGAAARPDERGPDGPHQRQERRRPRGRAHRTAPAPRERWRRARRPLDVQTGQGLRLQIVNAATIRYMRLRLTDNAGATRSAGPGRRRGRPAQQRGPRRQRRSAPAGTLNTQLPAGRDPAPARQPRRRRGGHPARLGRRRCSRSGPRTTSAWAARGLYSSIPTVPGDAPQGQRHRRPGLLDRDGTPLRQATGDPVETLGAATGDAAQPGRVHPGQARATRPRTSRSRRLAAGRPRIDGDDRAPRRARRTTRTTPHIAGSTRYAKAGDILELTVAEHDRRAPPVPPARLLDPADRADEAASRPTPSRPSSGTTSTYPTGHTLTFRCGSNRGHCRTARPPAANSAAGCSTATSSSTPSSGMISELVVTNAGRQRAAERQRRTAPPYRSTQGADRDHARAPSRIPTATRSR